MSEQKALKDLPVRLEGRVAQLLNARELVINIGVGSGVRTGMKFAVLAESPLEIRDPVTNQVLDSLDREKVRVEVSEVREKISICRTYRNLPSEGIRMPSMLREYQDRPETLLMRDSALPPPIEPSESYIKVNDRVISVVESR